MALSIGEILRQYGDEYMQSKGVMFDANLRKAIYDLRQCRTEALGGHVYDCPDCGEIIYKYHSCKNRHCPLCQYQQTKSWLSKQADLLLPVDYFMLTFTIPAGLRSVVQMNQRVFYNLMFQVTAEATQQLAQDVRYLGANLGMLGVLQTWSRTLAYHPHIHYLVTAGGLTKQGSWLPVRSKKFLMPVHALSKLVRGKFRAAVFKAELAKNIPKVVWKQDWVVDCQPAVNSLIFLKYLAPYVRRVPLSNRRLVDFQDHGSITSSSVTFSYRTNKEQDKTMTLSVKAFLQRILQHILPKGFVHVRYFGIMAASQRKKLLPLRQLLLAQRPAPLTILAEEAPAANPHLSPDANEDAPFDKRVIPCPKCGHPMRLLAELPKLLCRSP